MNQEYWLLMKMTDFSFQIRIICPVDVCQDFNNQDFELIFSTVSAVHFAL